MTLEDASDLALDSTALDRLSRPLEPATEAPELVANALGEPLVHGHLLGLAILGSHQDEGLLAARSPAELDLEAIAHLVSERKTISSDDQSNADLLAVGAHIATVAPLRLWIGFGFSLEVGRGDVVQEQVVVHREQPTDPVLDMGFERALVLE